MKKKSWVITVLLAVIVMCLAFTACPPDTKERFVTFENNTKIKIDLTFDGIAPVTLEVGTQTKGTSKTVSRVGADIVLQSITYGDNTVDNNPERYIELKGTLIQGKKQKKDVVGIPLAGGRLEFWPDKDPDNWSAANWNIKVIPLDD